VKVLFLALLCAASLLLAPVADVPPAAPAASASPTTPLRTLPFAAAAQALRGRDCVTALRELDAAGRSGTYATEAALLAGLYAHACDDPARAETALFAAAGGELEDWRLELLADSAAALGHLPLAEASLRKLLADHRDSPLWGRALVRALTLAKTSGDFAHARELVAAGREAQLAEPLRAELESLAWQTARLRGDRDEERRAARFLLVSAPFVAATLQVVDSFRETGKPLDWSFLAREEKLQRSRNLLAAGVAAGALSTLETFAPAERDTGWHVLQARALVLDHRGFEALTLLQGLGGATAAETAALDYARAQAALDAATPRRGGKNLPSAERVKLRELYRKNLWSVARSNADPALARPALRELWADLEDADRFEEAMQALQLLRALDPTDTSGARFLWDSGWKDYRGGNASGAIGHWSRLREFYPESRLARAALYWSGRAFEKLGDAERAQGIFRLIAAASANDFYRRHAKSRLGGPAPAAAVVATAWPRADLFGRAERLSDLGLDSLALAELDAQIAARPGIDAAVPQLALRARVLARQGGTRESLRLLRLAFPELGGPDQGAAPAEALALFYPRDFENAIAREAARQGVPVEIVFGIVHQESGFDPQAVSRSGARGLMQLMPPTARELSRRLGMPFSTARLSDPEVSLRLGTSYFRQVLDMFSGNVELALAGYNSGPFRIQRLWRGAVERDVDLFVEDLALDEPRAYVKRILVSSDSYRRLSPGS
jgi:soluble lytic murein transglycosylase-like protein